jgi:hypothetical protein
MGSYVSKKVVAEGYYLFFVSLTGLIIRKNGNPVGMKKIIVTLLIGYVNFEPHTIIIPGERYK